MKNKFLFTLILIILIFSFSACGNLGEELKCGLTSSEWYYIKVAEDCTTSGDINSILQEFSSKEFQLQLAKCKNPLAQVALLRFSDLTSETLVYICEHPNFEDLNDPSTKNDIINAIRETYLTPQEELKIIETNQYPMQLGILFKDNISVESLFAILKNSKYPNYVLDLDMPATQRYIINHLSNMTLTQEQLNQIGNLNIDFVNKFLIEKNNEDS